MAKGVRQDPLGAYNAPPDSLDGSSEEGREGEWKERGKKGRKGGGKGRGRERRNGRTANISAKFTPLVTTPKAEARRV